MKLFGYTITMKRTPKKKRKMPLGSKRWSAEDTQTMLDLTNSGKSHAEIGEYLNRTPHAIAGRLHSVRSK